VIEMNPILIRYVNGLKKQKMDMMISLSLGLT
jgi:hypothetical protein